MCLVVFSRTIYRRRAWSQLMLGFVNRQGEQTCGSEDPRPQYLHSSYFQLRHRGGLRLCCDYSRVESRRSLMGGFFAGIIDIPDGLVDSDYGISGKFLYPKPKLPRLPLFNLYYDQTDSNPA